MRRGCDNDARGPEESPGIGRFAPADPDRRPLLRSAHFPDAFPVPGTVGANVRVAKLGV